MIRPASNVLIVAALAALALGVAPSADAQIARHPTGVNVNAQGATTVFITFGNLQGYVPDEALWCGELVPATPDIGNMCDPTTIFGSLPLRLNLSRASGDDGFTDIMSIPASVARRAYQAAEAGQASAFFYVRRFVDPTGVGPDQYVTVTCRMTGGGARVPLSLLDVRLAFATENAVQVLQAGEAPPPLEARIVYNGTGRLQGRWEVVMPGDEPPTQTDLLTEATLPAELRGTQRIYTELERFNHFLPPSGEFVLPGPDPARLPTETEGAYWILLRVEATGDKEGDTDLAAAGAGQGTLVTGAVAGFPLPPLRYWVGAPDRAAADAGSSFRLLEPAASAPLPADGPLAFSWTAELEAVLYRVQFRGPDGGLRWSGVVEGGMTRYTAPPRLRDEAGEGLDWRVVALGPSGLPVRWTPWRRIAGPPPGG